MAEAIARYDAADVIEPSSAGLSPLGAVAEQTKQTLLQNGYSANGLTSDVLTREGADAADIIINMTGELVDEGFWDQAKVEDWMVQDPYGPRRKRISACSRASNAASTNWRRA